MKNKKFLVLFFIFLAIFIVGVIGLIIPFDFEKYSYSPATSTFISGFEKNGSNIKFVIYNNSDKEEKDVDILIEYAARFNHNTETFTRQLEDLTLKKGNNTITFAHEIEKGDSLFFKNLKEVSIKINNKEIKLYQKGLLVGPNWYLFGCTVIGAIAGFVFFILWKISDKKLIDPEFGNTMKTFEEKIKQAFQPINDEQPQDEKVTCHYCKCKYSYAKHDKCPNCGAPPEPKD